MNNLSFTFEDIIIYERTRILILKYEEIVCFTTDRPYIIITTAKKQRIHIQAAMSKMFQKLPPIFCFCNQSVIINLLYVNKYEEQNGHSYVSLSNSDSFEISRRCKKNVKDKMLHLRTVETGDKQEIRVITIDNE